MELRQGQLRPEEIGLSLVSGHYTAVPDEASCGEQCIDCVTYGLVGVLRRVASKNIIF